MKFDKSIEYFSEKQALDAMTVITEKENRYICETAGFIPLEVKMKQFEQNGLIAQFHVQDFDSHDYREMYLNPDFNITPEDDFEDVEEKIAMQRDFIQNLKKAKSAGLNEKAGTEEPKEKKAAEAAETVENIQE